MSDLISTQELVAKIVDTAIRKILSGEQKLTKEYEQSVKEAVNVALNTARQGELMDDVISRQEAIDVLEERLQANGYSNVALVSESNRSIGYLRRLPSAQPQRTGLWINDHCSECGQYVWYGDMRKYCPNCGARMDGEIEAWNRRGMNG